LDPALDLFDNVEAHEEELSKHLPFDLVACVE